MRTELLIVNDEHKLAGQTVVNDYSKWHYIKNLPEDHDHHEDLYMCGMEMQAFHSDQHLTADQIEYLISRLRGMEYGAPSGYKISVWLGKDYEVHVGIGYNNYTYHVDERRDRSHFLKWLDASLEELE